MKFRSHKATSCLTIRSQRTSWRQTEERRTRLVLQSCQCYRGQPKVLKEYGSAPTLEISSLRTHSNALSDGSKTDKKWAMRNIVYASSTYSMRGLLPTLSIMYIVIKLARKYSVPLHAAIILDFTSSIPRRSNKSVFDQKSDYLMSWS